ncbi:alkaline phosphatase family protein [Marinicaulis aureus]|uniref:Alkaline phosphatase family protein n=1 Tax=Hyphococcus aureus TaxID=2666033 RepID=A0ABW1KZM4_9PROT
MPAKILMFGFDGADPAFMDSLIEAGELPNFKRIRDQAAVHPIENDAAQGAAQFWNSASIGAGIGHHGHYFFMQFKPDTYDILPNHESSIRDITPFWNRLDDEGYRVAVVDWHRMQPKPMRNGHLVDNWLGHDPLTETIWHPQSLAEEGAKFFKGDAIGGGFEFKPRETAEEIGDYLHHLFNRINSKTEFCCAQLRDHDWDMFISCFSDVHDVGHHLYHLEDETHELYDPEIARIIKKPLSDCYRRVDAAIGKIIDAAGPGAQLFAYGGPGMEPLISANSAMEEMLRRIDWGVEAPPTVAETAKKSFHSLVPVSLRRRLAPLARAVRRKVAVSDFARRRFFAVPHNDNSGAIRINVKGREKHGVVEPGADYDAVVKEITDAVMTFKNADTGLPIAKRVVRMRGRFDGPYAEDLPDLFVDWDRSTAPKNFSKIVSDMYGEIDLAPVQRTGDHNPSGFFWTPPELGDVSAALPEHITAPIMDAVRRRCEPSGHAAASQAAE